MLSDLFTDTGRTLAVDSRIDGPEPACAPLFFYHVPKTGGTYVHEVLKALGIKVAGK